jgi:hypothetical protein
MCWQKQIQILWSVVEHDFFQKYQPNPEDGVGAMKILAIMYTHPTRQLSKSELRTNKVMEKTIQENINKEEMVSNQ